MNKRIKPWFIAAFIVEAASVVVWSLWLVLAWNVSGINKQPTDFVIQGALLFAGLWIPMLAAFIGVCTETVTKRLRCMPIAVGSPFVLSLICVLWMQTHPGSDFEGISRALFYIICGIFSALLLIVSAFRAAAINEEREKFTEMSDELIVSKTAARWLIAFILLTVVCVITAIFGFVKSVA